MTSGISSSTSSFSSSSSWLSFSSSYLVNFILFGDITPKLWTIWPYESIYSCSPSESKSGLWFIALCLRASKDDLISLDWVCLFVASKFIYPLVSSNRVLTFFYYLSCQADLCFCIAKLAVWSLLSFLIEDDGPEDIWLLGN